MHLACRGPSRGAEGRTREPSRTQPRREGGARTHRGHSACAPARRVVEAAAVCRIRGPVEKYSDTAIVRRMVRQRGDL